MGVQGQAVIHVVDDDAAVRESLEALLIVSGFDVVTHASAEALLEHGREGLGCLIVDINMPGMSGLELLERLGGRETPVVVLTAARDPRLLERALALGAVKVLSKPVTKEDLLGAIAAAQAACGRTPEE